MRYRILGPIEVRDGERTVPLGHGRQRLLLAVLLVHANETLSSDRLIEALWGESPPPTAGRSLHNLISGLRKTLGNGALVTHGRGYALRVVDEELDARRFEALADRGRTVLDDGDAEDAARLLGEALGLWRGEALADVAYESAVVDAAARLEERRLEASEDRIDADLAVGRHADVLIEIERLAVEHPTRERIRAQQMLALYRAGRQAEALRAYGDARRHLVSELGIEPGPALRRLERAILEQDPALGTPDALPPPPASERRRRLPLALGAAGALMLCAVLVAVLLANGQARGGLITVAGDSVAEIDPATNLVVAEYPVGVTPTVVTAAGSAVWTVNADGQTISRIDARTKTVRTFSPGAVPLDVAAAGEGVWAITGDRDETGKSPPTTLARLDAVTGSELETTTLQPDAGQTFIIPPQLVAVTDGAVWAIGRTRRLHRRDRRTGRTTVIPALRVDAVAAGGGQLWALADGPRGPRLVGIDPGTGAVTARLDVPATEPGPLAVAPGTIWLTDATAGAVWRVDTHGRPLWRSIPLEEGVDGIALGAGAVWATNSLAGTVTRIDPKTNRLTRIAVGNTPRSIAVSDGRVWVAVAGGGRPTVPAAGSLKPGARVTPLTSSACGPVLSAADGQADLLVAAELPLQAPSARPTTHSMAAAIAFVMREHRFRAGRFRVALQTCDHSTAQSALPFDDGKCEADAKAEAANPSIVGVIGPVHSGCAGAIVPILNRAPGGPLALVSPANTAKFLVRPDPDDPAGQLRRLYPTGQRGYARLMPTEDHELAAQALLARRLGHGTAFYLEDRFTAHQPAGEWFRFAASRIGLRIAGSAVWNPERKSFRHLAERVRASGAGAVVVEGNLATGAAPVIRDLREALGPHAEIIAWSGVTPFAQLFAAAGAAARGVHITQDFPMPDRDSPATRRFTRAFGATQHGGRVTPYDAYAAAAAEVMLDSIARSDGTRTSVTHALAQTRLRDSPVGPVAFDRHGEPVRQSFTVVRAERDPGSIPYVYNDITGGVIEDTITPPARLVAGGD